MEPRKESDVQWWTGAVAFVGAGLGGWLSYLASRRDARQRDRAARGDRGQREEQGHLEEWGRRFTAALEGVASGSFRRRELGRVVLVQLSVSDLATPEETRLAEAVLDAGARLDEEGDDVTVRRPGLTVDEVVYVEDNEDEEGARP